VSQFITALEQTKKPLPDKAAAVQAWLAERVPLPKAVTHFSQLGAEVPIAPDGTMPQTLYGQPINFLDAFTTGGLEQLHIIYGTTDDVVTPEVALHPLSLPAVEAYLREHPEAITHSAVTGGHIAPMLKPDTDAVEVFLQFAAAEVARSNSDTSGDSLTQAA